MTYFISGHRDITPEEFETDRDRDSAMTNVSSEDIAFIRSKSKWDSGTAENILRRHTMKYLNPSFYGQQ